MCFYNQIGLSVSASPSLRASRISIAPSFDRSPIARLRRDTLEDILNEKDRMTPRDSRKSSLASIAYDNSRSLRQGSIGEECEAKVHGSRRQSICSVTPKKGTLTKQRKYQEIVPEITIVDHSPGCSSALLS